jgi:hypothetical protein
MKRLWPEYKVSQYSGLPWRGRPGNLGFDSRKEQEIFVFSKATKPVSYPLGNMGYSDKGVKLISHHVMSKLRMGGAELVKHREIFTFYRT